VKRKRFTVEVPVMELCRQAGIAEQIFYPWKKQYVGLEIDRIRQLKQLQEENVQLKKLVAELSPRQDHTAGCAGKNILKPSRRRSVMTYLAAHAG
jgi:putative transposase